MIAECLILIFIIVACITLIIVFYRRNRSRTIIPLKGGAVTDEQVIQYYDIVCAEADPIRTSNELPINVVQMLNEIASNVDDCCELIQKVSDPQMARISWRAVVDFRPVALIPLFRDLNNTWIKDFCKNTAHITAIAEVTRMILIWWRSLKYFDALKPHVLRTDTICQLYTADSPEIFVDAINDQDIIYRLSVLYDMMLNLGDYPERTVAHIHKTVLTLKAQCHGAPFICPTGVSVGMDALAANLPGPGIDKKGLETLESTVNEVENEFISSGVIRNLLIASNAIYPLDQTDDSFIKSLEYDAVPMEYDDGEDIMFMAYGSVINTMLNTDLGLEAVKDTMVGMATIYTPREVIDGIVDALFDKRIRGRILSQALEVMRRFTGIAENAPIMAIVNDIRQVRDNMGIDIATFANMIAMIKIGVTKGCINSHAFWEEECKKQKLQEDTVNRIVGWLKDATESERLPIGAFMNKAGEYLGMNDGFSTEFMLNLLFVIATYTRYAELAVFLNAAYGVAYAHKNGTGNDESEDLPHKELINGYPPCCVDVTDNSALNQEAFTDRVSEIYASITTVETQLIEARLVDPAIFQMLIDSYDLKANLLMSGVYTIGDKAIEYITLLLSVLDYYLTILHLHGDHVTRMNVLHDINTIARNPIYRIVTANTDYGETPYHIEDRLKNIYLLAEA